MVQSVIQSTSQRRATIDDTATTDSTMDFSALYDYTTATGNIYGGGSGLSMPSLLDDEQRPAVASNIGGTVLNGGEDQFDNARELIKLLRPEDQQQPLIRRQQPPKPARKPARKRKTPAEIAMPTNTDATSTSERKRTKPLPSALRQQKHAIPQLPPSNVDIAALAMVPPTVSQPPPPPPSSSSQSQPLSFHAFVKLLTCYNSLPSDAQQQNAEWMRAARTADEANLCTGTMLTRRSTHDQFHLLCQGTNVNPECAKRHVLQKTPMSMFVCDLTDKMMLRLMPMWYRYATPESCSLARMSTFDFVNNVMNSRLVDDRLGRICDMCMEHFLRLNNSAGKLCNKLYQQTPQRTITTAKFIKEATAAAAAAPPMTARAKVGLGAARKKIAVNREEQPNNATAWPPVTDRNDVDIDRDDNVVDYMSDSTDDEDSERDDDDNDDDDENGIATMADIAHQLQRKKN